MRQAESNRVYLWAGEGLRVVGRIMWDVMVYGCLPCAFEIGIYGEEQLGIGQCVGGLDMGRGNLAAAYKG